MKRLGFFPLLLLLGCEALWGRFNKPHFELAQASRSSTIAISQDDGVLVLVNQEHGSISIFDPTTLARTAVVPTGREPCSVVLHPDGDTATRARIWQDHTDFIQGMLWFLGHDERVPQSLRESPITTTCYRGLNFLLVVYGWIFFAMPLAIGRRYAARMLGLP